MTLADKLRAVVVNAAATISRTAAAQRVLAMVYGDDGTDMQRVAARGATAASAAGDIGLQTRAALMVHDAPSGAILVNVQSAASFADANNGSRTVPVANMLLRQVGGVYDRLRGHVNDLGALRPPRDTDVLIYNNVAFAQGTTTISALRAGIAAFKHLTLSWRVVSVQGAGSPQIDLYLDVQTGVAGGGAAVFVNIIHFQVAAPVAGTIRVASTNRDAAGLVPFSNDTNPTDLAANTVRDGAWGDQVRVRVVLAAGALGNGATLDVQLEGQA